ncbi:thioredoxin fold domain-containing protein [Ignatzschineria sp. LJL83]
MKKLLLSSAIFLGLSSSAFAEANLQHFNNLIQGVTIEKVQASEIDGLYEVFVKESLYPIFLSKDGKYMLEGNAIDLVKGVNLSESYVNSKNKAKLATLAEKDMVIYKAPNEKYVVTVFTTTDCPFCRRLHDQRDEYLAEGITIRYLGFPFRGLSSQGYSDLVSIWCSDDRKSALDNAVKFADGKGGSAPKSASCKNPIQDQYQLGIDMGVSGTPAIVMPDGSIIAGYVPAKELVKRLELLD